MRRHPRVAGVQRVSGPATIATAQEIAARQASTRSGHGRPDDAIGYRELEPVVEPAAGRHGPAGVRASHDAVADAACCQCRGTRINREVNRSRRVVVETQAHTHSAFAAAVDPDDVEHDARVTCADH